MNTAERVMAVQRSLIDPLCSGDFTGNVEPIRAVIRERAECLERGGAEQNFSYKQIIPYVVLRHGAQYLLIKRLPKQGEKRLHNKFSLGVGGHINVFDRAQGDILEAGMQREKNEEIKIAQEGDCRLIGVINTDVAEVDRVHLGVVYVQTCLGPAFTNMEPQAYEAEWKSPGEIAEQYPLLESWSKIVFDHLVKPKL